MTPVPFEFPNVMLYDILSKAADGQIWQVNVGLEGPFDGIMRDPQFDKGMREAVIENSEAKPTTREH